MEINNIIFEELSLEAKKRLKKIGLGLGLGALAAGGTYGAHKLNQHLQNRENERVANVRKNWNIAQHGVNAGLIYKNTTRLFGDRIRTIPASLYLAKNFRNEKVRDKESILQKAMNRQVDKLSGADNKLKMLFNHRKINRKRLLLTHAANALYAGAKIGGQALINHDKIKKHATNLGLNFLNKAFM